MKLVFFGSGSFGLPALSRLASRHEVVLVVTQPDRPAGRHRHVAPTPVAGLAADLGLDTLKAADVNDAAAVERIRGAAAEALVVIAFGQKLGPDLLRDAFAINLHASLLPRYRGAAPVNWAMINGEAETGVSVIAISQRIDAGDVLARRAVAIDPDETAGELEERLALLGADLVMDTLDSGRLEPIAQDERLACRAPKLTKADGTVRFDQPAAAVQRRAHGLTPWPGCTVSLNGRRLKLLRVAVADESGQDAAPGELLPDGTIACAPGRVRLVEVQPAGGRAMPFDDYRRGRRLRAGARIETP